MRNLNNLLFILITLLFVPALSSCGQKGPLKLPPSPPPQQPQNTPPKLLQTVTDSASTQAGQ